MSDHTLEIVNPLALYSDTALTAPLVALLPAGSEIEVRAAGADWVAVRAGGHEGFASRTALDDAESARSLDEPPMTRGDLDLSKVPLEPPTILKGDPASDAQLLVARTWNRFGGALGAIAEELGVEPGLLAALLAIEAGGNAFGSDGRMIIRFENHIFDDLWGKNNPNTFARHFRYDRAQRWKGHEWRPSPDQPWRPFHGDQAKEWEVFTFARGLSVRPATHSISMGAAQIMGFNHWLIGYRTPEEMFDAFSADVRAQIRGKVDFIRASGVGTRRVQALRSKDLVEFARLYNGESNKVAYANKLRAHFDAFRQLQPDADRRKVAAAGLNLRRERDFSADGVIRVLPRAAEVLLLGEVQRADGVVWVRVRAGEDEGWVSGAFLEPRVT